MQDRARIDTVLAEQVAYYRARAGEYDRWFFRQGRYDRGEAANRRWFAEVAQVAAALAAFRPQGQVLELAGGTGLWTQRLLESAAHVTVVDASGEVLALNAARVCRPAQTAYVRADLFAWTPPARYDVVFFSFWLSHVPPERFADFWRLVDAALAPGGRVFLIDSLRTESSTARDHRLPDEDERTMVRRLDDGREFQIYKLFYTPQSLGPRLSELGWVPALEATPNYFLYGSARRSADVPSP